jgi:cytidylate kinase
MAIVTISRQVGAGGEIIASNVAEGLGYDLVSSSLIVQVAEEAGVRVEYVKSLDEISDSKTLVRLKSLVELNIGKILGKEYKYLDERSFLTQEGYSEYVEGILLELKKKGNVVIVGRGGQYILKDFNDVFHVRIIADLDSRVQRLSKNHSIAESDAREHIKKMDKMRKNYIERFFNAALEDPLAYHIVINTSKIAITQASRLLIEAIKEFSAIKRITRM